ncbi:MAG: HAMP domain-containing histidine kinase [Lachnospiraceae bacterium]|nr:HAMP domain-containing histidine kinase [Lachnospiraceae bacterium]
MKKFPFVALIILTFLAEASFCFFFIYKMGDTEQDALAVNECVKSVGDNFGNEEKYSDILFYTVVDLDGTVLYKNAEGLSASVNEAIKRRDTILDVTSDGEVIGKILIHNDIEAKIRTAKKGLAITIALFSALQLLLVLGYYLYLRKTIIEPFHKMNEFAIRVAGGDLDIPLEVDKKHVFGSFTEAFDLMRSELKKAKIAEKQANDEKKETIAKLSHDIKTPVASIKSSSEIGYELAGDNKSKEYFHLINEKADQITTLTDNLFHSAIHEITEISVSPSRQSSDCISKLIKNADYLGKAGAFDIPKCDVFIDKLRLQQAFDNLFMNSYKYAGTEIEVSAALEEEYLIISVRDFGPGVSSNELPLLKEKYKRGSNTAEKEGAGLGLYLTDYFLNAMNGKLKLESKDGFTAIVSIRRAE